jgi:hypothetical protein
MYANINKNLQQWTPSKKTLTHPRKVVLFEGFGFGNHFAVKWRFCRKPQPFIQKKMIRILGFIGRKI